MGKLDGRIAIVTGSGRGIGRAIALKLASEGAHLVVNDLDEGPAAETVAAIEQAGGRAVAVNGDATAADFGERIMGAALDRYGDLHIIVNNAGYVWNSAIHNHTDEQWQAMLDVHATAPFRVLRAAARHIREAAPRERAEGRNICRKVVNISSISGVYGAATQAGYAAGKMAVVGLTRTLAKEWGRYNVTVNAVAFGFIETRLTQPFEDKPATVEVKGKAHKVGFKAEGREALKQLVPMARFGTPEDAAGAVYLLCIPESDYVTGEVLVCGGGIAGY